ncbi:MAG: beta-ketoacyl synthase N-terminal-like domain-containing protein [Polyangia bacterium]
MRLLGSALVTAPSLASLDAPSSRDLHVERWAGRPARLARMDRLCAVALVAADGALLDAGVTVPSHALARVGVVLGTAFGCHATNEAYDAGARQGAPSPRVFAYTLPSSAVGEISIHAELTGPASTMVSGLTAGLDALREARRHLDAGRADRMLVVAADVMTPTVARLTSVALPQHDAACALFLDGTLPMVSSARFVANDPMLAARRCLEALELGGIDESWGPRGLALPGTHHDLDESLLAAAPLAALRQARGRSLFVAIDPSGTATAVVVG